MFSKLLKIRLLALFKSSFGRMFKNKKEQSVFLKIIIGVIAIYVIGTLLFSVGAMLHVIAEPIITMNMGWLYFSLVGIMCIILNFIGSVFVAKSQIFEAKDNELLLSMPIKPSTILASRISLILVLNFLFTLFIMLPAIVVYSMFESLTASMVVIFIAAILLTPLLSTAISCVLGWLVALITSRIRRKNLVTTFLMLGFFFAYMYLYTNMFKYIEKLISQGEQLASAIKKAIPPIYYYGSAIWESDFVHLGLFALFCVIPFVLVYIFLARSFLKLATTNRGEVKVKYKEKALSVSSVRVALLMKELRRFFTLPVYVLNCGLGAVVMLIIGGALVVKGTDFINNIISLPEVDLNIAALLSLMMAFCAVMTNTTSASISLEGDKLWIPKSMPIRTKDILFSKVLTNLCIGVPPIVITSIISWFVIQVNFLEGAVILILPIVIQILTALFGLCANLWFPRFDWVNETAVIKQSVSSIVGMLGSLVISIMPILLYFLFIKSSVSLLNYLLICCLIFLLIDLILVIYIKSKGVEIFEKL